MGFKIEKRLKGSLGRAGLISTVHGDIKTPAFVPVGTKATVKSVTSEQVRDLGAQVVLANTYHLHLQPGEDLVEKNGGLHGMMNWPSPTMTDSGGFQAFSLGVASGSGIGKFVSADSPEREVVESIEETREGAMANVTEEGVHFKSIIDGSPRFMSPEDSMQIQSKIGADIIFALDEFTSPHASFEKIKSTIERTERWAKRCLVEHRLLQQKRKSFRESQEKKYSLEQPDYFSAKKYPPSPVGHGPKVALENIFSPAEQNESPTKKVWPTEGREPEDFLRRSFHSVGHQALFGIVQGGRHEELRKMSANQIATLDFDGFGIGGTFIKEDMSTAVRWVNEILPEEKPRHLLGVGEPIDIFLGVENGCDTFDCVAPTRMARNGTLHTTHGRISILNSSFRSDLRPVDESCECYTCTHYNRSILAHLFRAKEMLAATLATIHNLHFVVNMTDKIRQSIIEDNFVEYKEEFLKKYYGI